MAELTRLRQTPLSCATGTSRPLRNGLPVTFCSLPGPTSFKSYQLSVMQYVRVTLSPIFRFLPLFYKVAVLQYVHSVTYHYSYYVHNLSRASICGHLVVVSECDDHSGSTFRPVELYCIVPPGLFRFRNISAIMDVLCFVLMLTIPRCLHLHINYTVSVKHNKLCYYITVFWAKKL